jgi:hypothetical protein
MPISTLTLAFLLPTLALAPATAPAAAPEAAAAAPAASSSDSDADAAALQGSFGATRVLIFDNDVVDGERLQPFGSNIDGRQRPHQGTLLTIRPHFNAELVRLALQ